MAGQDQELNAVTICVCLLALVVIAVIAGVSGCVQVIGHVTN